jgi:hypothetical protein
VLHSCKEIKYEEKIQRGRVCVHRIIDPRVMTATPWRHLTSKEIDEAVSHEADNQPAKPQRGERDASPNGNVKPTMSECSLYTGNKHYGSKNCDAARTPDQWRRAVLRDTTNSLLGDSSAEDTRPLARGDTK